MAAPALALECLAIEVPLPPAATLRDRIETALLPQGRPLRWAVTAIQGNKAIVEAVIYRDQSP